MSIEDTIRRIFEDRERRLASPVFKAEMRREQTELKKSFKDTGDHFFNATSSFVINGVLKPFQSGLKLMAEQKYKAGNMINDSLKGMGKATWDITKFLASIGLTTGRLVKILGRYTVAK